MADPLAAVAAAITKVLPAALGAMVSMKFLPATLSKVQRFTAALCAYAIGTYIGRGLCAYFDITNPQAVDAVVFGTALFGMSFVGTAMSEVKPLIQALRQKYVGAAPQDTQEK